MSITNHWPQTRKALTYCALGEHFTISTISKLVGLFLALALLCLLFPARAAAYTTTRASSGPTFQVNAGFNTRYRDGNWIPVQISLHNNGADFSGTLSIYASDEPPQYAGSSTSKPASYYQNPITLPNDSQKQVTVYIPLYFGAQSIIVNLLDRNGNIVGSQASGINPITPNDIFVGILSDSSSGFGPLAGVSLPVQGGSVITEPLDASTLPASAGVLQNFNLILLDNFASSTLSHDQLTALQSWVNSGGSLIIVGGPEWQRTLSTLPSQLQPVQANGTTVLPAGTSLLPVGSPINPDQHTTSISQVTASTATISQAGSRGIPAKSEIVLASGTTPLIVQAHLGQGTICYLAFDPTLEPIVGWTGANTLWKGLLLRSLGNKLLSSVSNPYSAKIFALSQSPINSILQTLLPNTLPSPLLLILLLLGYLAMLGPVRFFILRWSKRRDWSWRIILTTILIFSLLSYGLALHEKGSSLLSNTLTVVQLNEGGSSAHVLSWVGVFAPNQGDYSVHIPGNGLVQPSTNDNSQGGPARPFANGGNGTSIITTGGQDGADVNLKGVDIWTLRSVLSEQDRQMHGGIVSHLTLQSGVLTGTVTNTLDFALNDVYVLLPNSYISVGRLAPGQTLAIKAPINNAMTNPGMNLAAQIARDKGLPPYYGYDGSQPQNEIQRHVDILGALSGSGYYGAGYCSSIPCTVSLPFLPVQNIRSFSAPARRVVISVAPYTSIAPLSGGPYPLASNGSDPLLVAGTEPTLIGWADTDAGNSGMTINGLNPTGLHETVIQAKLDVNYAGQLTLPLDLIGRVIDIEGSNVQSQYPGTYSFSTGSMTFEFALPAARNVQITHLTLSEPSNIPLVGNSSGAVTDGSQHARLYNWKTGSWDAISMSSHSFSTSDTRAYIGPGGRILIQFANRDSSLGTVVFGDPSLNVEGTIGN